MISSKTNLDVIHYDVLIIIKGLTFNESYLKVANLTLRKAVLTDNGCDTFWIIHRCATEVVALRERYAFKAVMGSPCVLPRGITFRASRVNVDRNWRLMLQYNTKFTADPTSAIRSITSPAPIQKTIKCFIKTFLVLLSNFEERLFIISNFIIFNFITIYFIIQLFVIGSEIATLDISG